MEHENEDFVSSQQLFMSENKYTTTMKHHRHHQDDFPYDLPPPPNGWSSNQAFGVQTGSNFDIFDAFPYGSSSMNMDCFEYECKPTFAEINGYMNFHHLHSHGIDDQMVGSSNNNNNNQVLNLEAEIKPATMMMMNLDELDNNGGIGHQQQHQCEYYLQSTVSSNNSRNTHLINRSGRQLGILSPATATKMTWIKGRKKNNVVKGQWTVDEDRLLVQLVEQYGIRKWSQIAQMLPGRIGKQCRERWHNHLRPDIKKDTWTEEEDKVLIQFHAEIGNKWAEIAKRLPGRTENSIKNHWNATKRRQYSKRKCRSKYPRGSILQDYIKSLNLDHNLIPSKRSGGHKNNSNNNTTIPKAATSSSLLDDHIHFQQQHDLEEFSENDRLVPTFDYNNEEVPDFGFDGCSLDSLLDGLPPISCVDGKNFDELDVPIQDGHVSAVGLRDDFEVKKELDLVEMMINCDKQNRTLV